MGVKLVIFDCDRTLWDQVDVSGLRPPFRKIDGETVADARGELVRLFPHVREVLEALLARGIVCSVASWNDPEPVGAIFDLLDLRRYFSRPKVEPHLRKERMISALLRELADDGLRLRPEEVLFVDDRRAHLTRVREAIGAIRTLQPGVDFTDLRDILGWVAPGVSG